MVVSSSHRKYTLEEYVRLEEYANVHHEFLEGQIYAMAGGTPEHGTYAANIIGLLTSQLLGKPCRVQTSDVRIREGDTARHPHRGARRVWGRAARDARPERDSVPRGAGRRAECPDRERAA